MRRDRSVLVGIGLLDLRRSRKLPGKRGPHAEQRPGKGADRTVGEGFGRDDQMTAPDGLDRAFGPRRGGSERTSGDLLRLVERMLVGDGLRTVEGGKLW